MIICTSGIILNIERNLYISHIQNKKLIDIEALMNNNMLTAIEMSTITEVSGVYYGVLCFVLFYFS